MGIPSSVAIPRAEKQSVMCLNAVGASQADDECQRLLNIAQTLQPMPSYPKYANIRFLWEMLDMGNNTPVLSLVKDLVSRWTETEENIRRVASSVGRQPYDPDNLVSGFAIFRMKSREGDDWDTHTDHGRLDPRETNRYKAQSVVFLSLSDLSWENGFFMELKTGQYVCLDVDTELVYPRTGGGMGVVFWLRL